jgi:carboxymethylenebutenolidase
MLRCVRSIMRDVRTGSGRSFDRIDAVREWLIQQDDCTGQIGVIGFCLGGGYALMLAPAHGYAAASVNYGALPKDAERFPRRRLPHRRQLRRPDRSMHGTAEKLEGILTRNGIDHDVKQYPDAGHGFLNNHAPGEVPKLFAAMGRYARTAYHEPSARDAPRHITAFFTEHLIRP